jgi:hypothetical protein
MNGMVDKILEVEVGETNFRPLGFKEFLDFNLSDFIHSKYH